MKGTKGKAPHYHGGQRGESACPQGRAGSPECTSHGPSTSGFPPRKEAVCSSTRGRLGWGLREGDQALTEILQVQLPQAFIKHLLCTWYPTGHISRSVLFEQTPDVGTGLLPGWREIGLCGTTGSLKVTLMVSPTVVLDGRELFKQLILM